jgi:hypothetical protein
LVLDPLHEPAHRALMQLYEWAGQRAAALRQYQRCARVLQADLGEAPQAETTALYAAIRAGTAPPPPMAASALVVAEATVAGSTGPAPVGGRPPVAVQPLPLVGRAAEWATLLDRYAGVGPDGHLVVVEGEAGIGKTCLVEDFLAAPLRVGLVERCAGNAVTTPAPPPAIPGAEWSAWSALGARR